MPRYLVATPRVAKKGRKKTKKAVSARVTSTHAKRAAAVKKQRSCPAGGKVYEALSGGSRRLPKAGDTCSIFDGALVGPKRKKTAKKATKKTRKKATKKTRKKAAKKAAKRSR